MRRRGELAVDREDNREELAAGDGDSTTRNDRKDQGKRRLMYSSALGAAGDATAAADPAGIRGQENESIRIEKGDMPDDRPDEVDDRDDETVY